jgi:lipid-A-disaccharide synthase
MLRNFCFPNSFSNPMVRHPEKSWVPGEKCARDTFSGDLKFVVIVAGEASADLHGSNLVKAMKKLSPGIVFWGVGGKNMEEAGVKILFSSSEMAVVGITEVLSKLRTIARASGRLKRILKSKRPDLLILIDYPDFNIHIARTAKRFKVPVLYYISPQVWAWRRGRVRKIARRIDRMAVILPFEKTFYGKRGLSVDYVGHPLLDALSREVDKQQVGVELGSRQGYPVVGLLPGSRKEEIRNLLPVMVKSVQILGKRYPKIRCCLSLAPTIEAGFIQSFTENSAVKIEIIPGDTFETLRICHVALVASGTATLETALMGIPMVIAYKISRFSYWLGRIVVGVPYIGLVNLVAGEEVAPELIQDDVAPDRLAHEALSILEDNGIRENMIKKLRRIRESLGRFGASEATAKIALEMMKNRQAV